MPLAWPLEAPNIVGPRAKCPSCPPPVGGLASQTSHILNRVMIHQRGAMLSQSHS